MNTSKPFGVFLFLVFSTQLAFTQNRTITGTVTSASNDSALFGVNIIVKGTSRGEQTDLNGTYSIDAKIGEVLVFSYIGQTTVEVLIGESDTINVSMTESVGVLDEVIIIAYGEQTKQKLVQSTSIVANRDIKDIPALAPQELLQGQAAGVQVVNSSGVLGSSPVIKIRGAASLTSGGRPLVVVDGVPLDDTNRGFSLGSQPLNPLGDINPNDIESFSILKDASATAIYGSRGANGVILITTKKGRKNQPTRLSLNVSTSWNESTDQLDMMNADQFREYRLITGLAQPGQDPETSFDWPGSVFRTGFSQQVQFNASGGGDQTTFHISGTALNEEGFLIGNTLKRLSGRINLEHEMNDWVKFGINLGVTRNNNDRLFTENSSRSLTSAYLIQPWILPRDENGNFVSTGFAGNVIAAEELDILYAETVRNIGNVFVELTPIKNLKFRSFFGIDRSVYEEFSRAVEVNVSGGFADDLVVQQNRFVFNNTLNYSKTFNATHDLALTAGMSYEETDRRSIYVSGTGFLSDDQINVISASTPGFSYNTTGGSRLVGYFGRANYAFKDKYIAEGSFRRDGSSKFGESNRYGTFYAFGAGWIISKESFMTNLKWIDALKLRANYGTSGNDRIGDFSSFNNFSGGFFANYSGQSGLIQFDAGNPNLKWERSRSWDIGLDAAFLNNRISVSLDYYKKTTDEMILAVPIPQTNGIEFILDNVGEMENRGFEIDLRTVNVANETIRWETSLNLGFNTNEVISLPGANLDSEGRRFIEPETAFGSNQRAIEGHSINTFYMIRYKGVNPDTGDAEWLDRDGNPTTTPTASDRVIVGDASPDLVGGFRNTVTYKHWDLNFFFNFSLGNDIYLIGSLFTDNTVQPFNKRAVMLDIWEQPGDQAYVPSVTSPTFPAFSQPSTLHLRDGSYARLKNITLGYNVPNSVLDKLGFVNGVRLYATANNLLTIRDKALQGVDPETTGSIANGFQGEAFFSAPQSRTFLTGIQINF